jgi:hypothetical protein
MKHTSFNLLSDNAFYFNREAPKERKHQQEDYSKAKSSKPKDRKPDYSTQRKAKRTEIEY